MFRELSVDRVISWTRVSFRSAGGGAAGRRDVRTVRGARAEQASRRHVPPGARQTAAQRLDPLLRNDLQKQQKTGQPLPIGVSQARSTRIGTY